MFKRNVGRFGILFASLGGIIGSGWLFGALFAAQMAGPAALVSWIIGGACILLLALTFAEVATLFPISGGVASYPIFTHGRIVGFVLTWITWLTYVVSIAQEVQSTIFYLANKFPTLAEKSTNGANVLTPSGMFYSFLITGFLVSLNSFGVKFLAKTNNLITIWKILVPFAVVVFFLFTSHNMTRFELHSFNSFAPYGIHGILSAVALSGVVYSFCGFQHGALLAGEAKDPQKSVPFALIGSISICLLLYLALQYSFIAALPDSSLANGWKALSFAGDAGPLAGLAGFLGISWLVYVLYVDSIISPLGTGVLYVASSARIVQNMAASGNAPTFFEKLTKDGSPLRALAFNFFMSLVAFLPFEGWQAIVSFLSSALVFSFAVGPICLISLRKTHPELKRPFRLPCHELIAFLSFYVCNLMIFWSGWDVVWKLAVCVFAGAIFYIIVHALKPNNSLTKGDVISSLWLFPYMAIMTIMSYYGSFNGGINKIKLGPDFIVMGVVSILIFYFAKYLSLSKQESEQHIKKIMGMS